MFSIRSKQTLIFKLRLPEFNEARWMIGYGRPLFGGEGVAKFLVLPGLDDLVRRHNCSLSVFSLYCCKNTNVLALRGRRFALMSRGRKLLAVAALNGALIRKICKLAAVLLRSEQAFVSKPWLAECDHARRMIGQGGALFRSQ